MKTNKQNKTNKKNVGSTSLVPEPQNRTEQLPPAETETASAKTPASAPAAENTPNAEGATLSAGGEGKGEVVPSSIKPYVNFAERDFNRTLSVEKVLAKLQRW